MLVVYIGLQWISIFLYSCCVMVIFLLIFFSWDFSLFFVVLRRCFVRICPFNTFTCFVYFGAGFVGTFLAGWVINFLSVWGFAMWRVGPVQFIWVLAWSRWRAVRVFSWAPLRWVRYDWNSGGCGLFLFSFFSLFCNFFFSGGCVW